MSVVFRITLTNPATTYILKPDAFRLASEVNFVARNGNHQQYDIAVPVVNCRAFAELIDRDKRITYWQTEGRDMVQRECGRCMMRFWCDDTRPGFCCDKCLSIGMEHVYRHAVYPVKRVG